MTRALCWSSILYRNLLRVCPERREEFGAEMTLVFEDDLREACLDRGARGFICVWRCAASELLHAGLSRACAAPSVIVALTSFVASAFCFGGELALARAHALGSTSTMSLAEAIWAVVMWPSLTAAAVSSIAVRAGTRVAPLRLTDDDDPHSPAMERL